METRSGWETESAGLCSNASFEVIAFDTCVSAAMKHEKAASVHPGGRPAGIIEGRAIIAVDVETKKCFISLSESWVTLHRSSFHIQMKALGGSDHADLSHCHQVPNESSVTKNKNGAGVDLGTHL